MPNTNCLKNIHCPKCHAEDEFYIDASVLAFVTDDGVESTNGSFSWDDSSSIECSDCGHSGTVAEFIFKPNA